MGIRTQAFYFEPSAYRLLVNSLIRQKKLPKAQALCKVFSSLKPGGRESMLDRQTDRHRSSLVWQLLCCHLPFLGPHRCQLQTSYAFISALAPGRKRVQGYFGLKKILEQSDCFSKIQRIFGNPNIRHQHFPNFLLSQGGDRTGGYEIKSIN